eukprot:1214235-Pyramimonas_sp.AAC.1
MNIGTENLNDTERQATVGVRATVKRVSQGKVDNPTFIGDRCGIPDYGHCSVCRTSETQFRF